MRVTQLGWKRTLGIIVALLMLATACGSDNNDKQASETTTTTAGDTPIDDESDEPAPTEAPEYGGKITVGLEAESNNWQPGKAQLAVAGLTVAFSIYDPLVSLTQAGDFEPYLAESLEPNDDLTEWTLKLRDGVTFHDGTPLDAETLVWNFDTLHFNPDSLSYGTLLTTGVTGIEQVDDMAVRYTLDDSNAAFPDILRTTIGFPISRKAYEADPEGFGDHPVGTGPFVFKEWNRDDRLVVTRNENYWRKDEFGNQLPYLDEITFRPLPDEDTRLQSFRAGDIDVIQTLRGASVKIILDSAEANNVTTSMYVGNDTGSAILNVLEPPLDDVRIRTALAHVSDPSAIQAVLGDTGLTEVSNGFFGKNSPWHSEKVTAAYPKRDVEAGKALVEEYKNDPNRSDGKPVGADVVLQYSGGTDPILQQILQLQQSLYQESGVVVEIKGLDSATMVANVIGTTDTNPPYKGDYQIASWRAGGGTGDPLTALQSFFGPVATSPTNFTNFTDPEIDRQLEILRTNADFDTRYAAVEAIGLIAAKQLPLLWSSPTPSLIAFPDRLAGIADWTTPQGSLGTGTPDALAIFVQARMVG